MSHPIKSPRKLIEVALPLDVINVAAAREKSIRHGHPSTLHLWWARRPLAATRAVIFAQMVNDPGYQQGGGFKYGKNKKEAAEERKRLFRILEELVIWENTTNERVLDEAREEILRSWREVCELNRDHPNARELFDPEKLPGLHDPFAGGGSIPLEAQRLGLNAFASDLNPVAVTINKAMIEIAPRFVGRPPIGDHLKSDAKGKRILTESWTGVRGLAEDVRRYGAWIGEEAKARIGSLYPEVTITGEMAKDRPDLAPMVGERLKVIAWLWARTVKSPNPAFSQIDVPLVSTFVLSKMAANRAYVEPIVEGSSYRFQVRNGTPTEDSERGTTAGKRAGFLCVLSGSPIDYKYIRSEGTAGRLGTRLMAVVAEGERGRVYLTPAAHHEQVAIQANPKWRPETPLHGKCRVNVSNYGMDVYGDLFTPRQLVALNTFSDLVIEAIAKVRADALLHGMADDSTGLDAGGSGATAYAEAVGVYLAFVTSSLADRLSTICSWDAGGATWGTKTRNTFSRQAIGMSWDFVEVNPFSGQSGSWENSLDYTAKGVSFSGANASGEAVQADASNQSITQGKVVSTDPPYYDNIGS